MGGVGSSFYVFFSDSKERKRELMGNGLGWIESIVQLSVA